MLKMTVLLAIALRNAAIEMLRCPPREADTCLLCEDVTVHYEVAIDPRCGNEIINFLQEQIFSNLHSCLSGDYFVVSSKCKSYSLA